MSRSPTIFLSSSQLGQIRAALRNAFRRRSVRDQRYRRKFDLHRRSPDRRREGSWGTAGLLPVGSPRSWSHRRPRACSATKWPIFWAGALWRPDFATENAQTSSSRAQSRSRRFQPGTSSSQIHRAKSSGLVEPPSVCALIVLTVFPALRPLGRGNDVAVDPLQQFVPLLRSLRVRQRKVNRHRLAPPAASSAVRCVASRGVRAGRPSRRPGPATPA